MDQEKVWDEIASSWKERREKIFPGVEKFLKNTKGNYLDLGCGSGRNFMKLSKARCFGVDFSEEMLNLARDTSKKEGVFITLKKADVSNLPFQDNFFDKILFHSVIHCIPLKEDRKRSLEEIYRTLQLGGTAMITAWSRKSPKLKNRKKETMVSWTNRDKKHLRYTYVYDFDELRDLLISVGFKIISCEEKENLIFVVEKV